MSHELWHTLWECGHARKVTRKGGILKMKIFAPVSSSSERAGQPFGLVRRRILLQFGNEARPTDVNDSPKSEVIPLQIEEQEQRHSDVGPASALEVRPWQLRTIGWTGAMFGLLQSFCTAILAISGIRVAIGLSAFAAAGGIYAPAKGWHQDAIRIPMLIAASVAAVVNLAVLAWIRHLRNRPSAQWRRRELTTKQKRSERLQAALAIITLLLAGLETWTHPMIHRKGPAPPCKIAGNCV